MRCRSYGKTRAWEFGASRSPVTKAIAALIVVSRRKETGKVLLEADARFFRDASGIGIQGPEKILDIHLHLLVARWDGFTWLDVVVHFRLHSCSSQKN
jgi:hypothetical protein